MVDYEKPNPLVALVITQKELDIFTKISETTSSSVAQVVRGLMRLGVKTLKSQSLEELVKLIKLGEIGS